MIKGAPVTTEATTLPEASATTEVQNNSAEVRYNSASASVPVDAEAPAKILIPLELWNFMCSFCLLGQIPILSRSHECAQNWYTLEAFTQAFGSVHLGDN